MASVSMIADDQADLEYENHHWNKQVMLENDSPALFSTDGGRLPKKPCLAVQPRQVRSDRQADLLDMISRLRKEFPVLCIMLDADDLKKHSLLCHYFDNFDLRFYGPRFLYDVLVRIVKENTSEEAARAKAERAQEVEEYCHYWIEANPVGLEQFEENHQWNDLFLPEHIEKYGFLFLWDAFWRIAQIKDDRRSSSVSAAYDTYLPNVIESGRILAPVTYEMPSSKMAHTSVNREDASRSLPARRLSLPQPQGQVPNYQRPSTSARHAGLDASPPEQYLTTRRVRPPLHVTTQPYTTQSTYLTNPHLPAPYYDLYVAETPRHASWHHAPGSIIIPPQTAAIHPSMLAGSNTFRNESPRHRKAGNRSQAGFRDATNIPQPYKSSPRSISQHHDSNGRSGPREYSRLHAEKSQGTRNPPKQDTDDARYDAFPVSHEDMFYGEPFDPRQATIVTQRTILNQRRSFSHYSQPRFPQASEAENMSDAVMPTYTGRTQPQHLHFGTLPSALERHRVPLLTHHDRARTVPDPQKNIDSSISSETPNLQTQDESMRKRTTSLHQHSNTYDSTHKAPKAQWSRENDVQLGEEVPCKLWIGGLPSHVTESQLSGIVSKCEGYLDIETYRKATMSHKNWALVRFQTQHHTDAALSRLSSHAFFLDNHLIAHRARISPKFGAAPTKQQTRAHQHVPSYGNREVPFVESPKKSNASRNVKTARKHPETHGEKPQEMTEDHKPPNKPAVSIEETTEIPKTRLEAEGTVEGDTPTQSMAKPPPAEKVASKSEKLAPKPVDAKQQIQEKTAYPARKDKLTKTVEPAHAPAPSKVDNVTPPAPKPVGGSSADFPPLSESVKRGNSKAKSTAKKPEPTVKSFAQIAGQGRSQTKTHDRRTAKPPSDVPSNPKPLKEPVKREQPAENTGDMQDQVKVADIKETIQHTEIEPETTLELPKDGPSQDLQQTVEPTSQPMSREQNSSLDTMLTSSPAEATTGLTSLQLDSPDALNASERYYEKSGDFTPDSGSALDPNQLRHRLEGAAPKITSEENAEPEQVSGSRFGLLYEEVSNVAEENTVQDTRPDREETLASPPKTTPKDESPPTPPLKATDELDKEIDNPATIAEAISTHKKKSRPKTSVTPIKKIQPSGSKTSKAQQRAEEPKLEKDSSLPRTQYPDVTTDRVTVLESPIRATDAQRQPQNTAETSATSEVPEPDACGDRPKRRTLYKIGELTGYDIRPTLAQGIGRGTEWAIIHQGQKDEDMVRFTNIARLMEDIPPYPKPGEVISLGDHRVRKHVDTALLIQYKLQKIATKEFTLKDSAEHAKKVLQTCPLQGQVQFDDPMALRSVIQWNVDNVDWVSNIPQDMVFDESMGADVANQARMIEQDLQDLATNYFKAHLQGWDDLGDGETSIHLAQQACNLQRSSTRASRGDLDGASTVTTQMAWNITALGFISDKKKADLWPDLAGLPPILRHHHPDYDSKDVACELPQDFLQKDESPGLPLSFPSYLDMNFKNSHIAEQNLATEYLRSKHAAATTPLKFSNSSVPPSIGTQLIPIEAFSKNSELKKLKQQIMKGHAEKAKKENEHRAAPKGLEIGKLGIIPPDKILDMGRLPKIEAKQPDKAPSQEQLPKIEVKEPDKKLEQEPERLKAEEAQQKQETKANEDEEKVAPKTKSGKKNKKKKGKKAPKEEDSTVLKSSSVNCNDKPIVTVEYGGQPSDDKEYGAVTRDDLNSAQIDEIQGRYNETTHNLRMDAIGHEHYKRSWEAKKGTPYSDERQRKVLEAVSKAETEEESKRLMDNATLEDVRKDMGLEGITPWEAREAKRKSGLNVLADAAIGIPDRLESEDECDLPGHPTLRFVPPPRLPASLEPSGSQAAKGKDAWRVPSGEAVWGKPHNERSGSVGSAGKGGRRKG